MTTTPTTAAIMADPYLFLELAAAEGSACLTFADDEAAAKHFFQRVKALVHGRAKPLGVWVRREGLVVRAASVAEAMPAMELKHGG